jgi:hypothetical protein
MTIRPASTRLVFSRSPLVARLDRVGPRRRLRRAPGRLRQARGRRARGRRACHCVPVRGADGALFEATWPADGADKLCFRPLLGAAWEPACQSCRGARRDVADAHSLGRIRLAVRGVRLGILTAASP